MAITTRQKGVAVVIEARPLFAGYINTDFPETRKAREQGQIMGEEGKGVTEVFVDITDEVNSKLVVKTPEDGEPVLPDIADVLTESAVDVVTGDAVRHWLVMEVGRPRKSGREVVVDLKLKRSEGVTLT